MGGGGLYRYLSLSIYLQSIKLKLQLVFFPKNVEICSKFSSSLLNRFVTFATARGEPNRGSVLGRGSTAGHMHQNHARDVSQNQAAFLPPK